MFKDFIGFYLAGILVNLTPCVYPMLSVTISLFKPKQAKEENLSHSFIKALCYVLGMAVMYSTLGFLAASSGKLFGAVLQSRWVLGGVALLFFTLSLSMFGLFQLAFPEELLNKLSVFRKASYFGLFASGMMVGVFAAPCIGPPVLALLAAVANNGDPAFGFWAFFIFSMGLGTPYLLLGTFSKYITKLPKAGDWLIWVERVFGLVLLGFAVFYLSLALNAGQVKKDKEMVFTSYNQELVQQAINQHQPLIIDFFAQWCFGCHEMDKKVFSDPMIKAQLAKAKAIRVDATNIDAPDVSKIIDEYQIVGLPTVIFINHDGRENTQLRIEGEVTKKYFETKLQQWADENKVDLK